jgi:hypothetical protein
MFVATVIASPPVVSITVGNANAPTSAEMPSAPIAPSSHTLAGKRPRRARSSSASPT